MGPVLWFIAELYKVEDRAAAMTAAERLCLRQIESKPILDQLLGYLQRIQVEVLPKSPAGRAVSYTLKNWTVLTRSCEDGDLSIDNNATERDIRGVAVGRNNWMFFGSDRGGQTAAILRSFTASCQRVGVEPFAWFQDVLSRIATHPINRIADLLPHNWKPALA
jgi:transposase